MHFADPFHLKYIMIKWDCKWIYNANCATIENNKIIIIIVGNNCEFAGSQFQMIIHKWKGINKYDILYHMLIDQPKSYKMVL